MILKIVNITMKILNFRILYIIGKIKHINAEECANDATIHIIIYFVNLLGSGYGKA